MSIFTVYPYIGSFELGDHSIAMKLTILTINAVFSHHLCVTYVD